MSLSRFFRLAELTHSDTAAREGIANEPAAAEVDCLSALCAAVLDPLREAVGQPIKVNSAYRGPLLNKRIGGATSSQHVEGKAADIQAAGVSVLDLFKRIIQLDLPFDQVIYEARSAAAKWVHVSYNGASNRREIRVAEFGPDGRPLRYPLITAEQALAWSEPARRSGRGAAALEYIEVGDEPEFELAPAATPSPVPAAARASKRSKPKRKATKPKRSTNALKPPSKRASARAKKTPRKSSATKISRRTGRAKPSSRP